jgi:hypothetical protein
MRNKKIGEFGTCHACAIRKLGLLVYNEDRSVHGHVFLKKVRTCDACAIRNLDLLVYTVEKSVHGHVFLKKVRTYDACTMRNWACWCTMRTVV